MEFFKKDVESKTKGEVEVQIYGDGVLGDQNTCVQSTQMGAIQMVVIPTTISQNMVREHKITTLPYLFPNWEAFRRLMETPLGQVLNTECEKRGLKVLTWGHTGHPGIQNSKRDIRVPEDLKGLKIRTMQDPILVDTIQSFGAMAVPMGVGELYSAVQQGVIDGITTGPALLYAWKMHELCKHYSQINNSMSPALVWINLKYWNSLPKNIQDIMLDSSKKWTEINNAYYLDNSRPTSDVRIFDEMRKVGVNVIFPDLAPFKEKTKPVFEKYKKEIGADYVDKVAAFIQSLK